MNGRETRTLIKQSESLTITLPKWWTNYYDLKAGDKVDLIIEDNQLIVITHKG